MITQWIVGAFAGLIRGLLAPLPAWDLGTSTVTGFAQVAGTTGQVLQNWFPLTTLVVCLGILLAAHLALGIWTLVLFVYHQFWGSS